MRIRATNMFLNDFALCLHLSLENIQGPLRNYICPFMSFHSCHSLICTIHWSHFFLIRSKFNHKMVSHLVVKISVHKPDLFIFSTELRFSLQTKFISREKLYNTRLLKPFLIWILKLPKLEMLPCLCICCSLHLKALPAHPQFWLLYYHESLRPSLSFTSSGQTYKISSYLHTSN